MIEYRKTRVGLFMRCKCGTVLENGGFAFVPVESRDGAVIYHRAVCGDCKDKACKDGHYFASSDRCEKCSMTIEEACEA